MISVKIDPSQTLRVLDPARQVKILKTLTDRVGAKCLTIMKKHITSEYKIKTRDVYISRKKATNQRLTNIFGGSRYPVRLSYFKVKEAGHGVDVNVLKSGATYIPDSFIARPKGRNWKKYGQQKQVTSKVPFVFAVAGSGSYPLYRPEGQQDNLSLIVGREIASAECKSKITAMIDAEAAKMLESEINWNLVRKRNL